MVRKGRKVSPWSPQGKAARARRKSILRGGSMSYKIRQACKPKKVSLSSGKGGRKKSWLTKSSGKSFRQTSLQQGNINVGNTLIVIVIAFIFLLFLLLIMSGGKHCATDLSACH
jgi:hypothetical protein